MSERKDFGTNKEQLKQLDFEPRSWDGILRSHEHINDVRLEVMQYGLDYEGLGRLAVADLAIKEAFDAECWRIFMDAGDSIAGWPSREQEIVAQTWERLLNDILSWAHYRLRILNSSVWKVPLIQHHVTRTPNSLNESQRQMLEATTRQRWQPLIEGQVLSPQTMQQATDTLVPEQLAEESRLLLSRA